MSVKSDSVKEVSDSESEDWCMITLGGSQDEEDTLTPGEGKLRYIYSSGLQIKDKCSEEVDSQNKHINENETVDLQEPSKDIRHLSFMHVYNDTMDTINFNEKITAVIHSSTPTANSDLDTMNANINVSEVNESQEISSLLPIKRDMGQNVVHDSEDLNFTSSSNVLEATPKQCAATHLSRHVIGSTVSSYECIDIDSNKTIPNKDISSRIAHFNKAQNTNEFARLSKLFHGLSSESDSSDTGSTILDIEKGEESLQFPVLPNVANEVENHQNITKKTLELIPTSPIYLDFSTLFESEFETKIAVPDCKTFITNSLEIPDNQRDSINVTEDPKYVSTILQLELEDRVCITPSSDPLSPTITGTLFDTEYGLETAINDYSSATERSIIFSNVNMDNRKVITDAKFNSCHSNMSSTNIDETFSQDSREIESPIHNSESSDDSCPSSLAYSDLVALFDTETESEPTIPQSKLSLHIFSKILEKQDMKSSAAFASLDSDNCIATNNKDQDATLKCVSAPTSPTLIDILPLFDNEHVLDASVPCCRKAIECSETLSSISLKENCVITNEKLESEYSIKSYNNEILTYHSTTKSNELEGPMHNLESSDDSGPSSLAYSDLGALFDSETESEPTIKRKLSLDIFYEMLEKQDMQSSIAFTSLDSNNCVITNNKNQDATIKCVSTSTSPTSIDILPLFDYEHVLDASVSYCRTALECSENLTSNIKKENLVIANEISNSGCSIKFCSNKEFASHSITIAIEVGDQMHNPEPPDDSRPSSLAYSDLGALFESDIESESAIIRCKDSLDKGLAIIDEHDNIPNVVSSSLDLNNCVVVNTEYKETMNEGVPTPTSPTLLDIVSLFEIEHELGASVSDYRQALECSENISTNIQKDYLIIANEKLNSECSNKSCSNKVLAYPQITTADELGDPMNNSEASDDSCPSLTYPDFGVFIESDTESEPTIEHCKLYLDDFPEILEKQDMQSDVLSFPLDLINYAIAKDENKEAIIECISIEEFSRPTSLATAPATPTAPQFAPYSEADDNYLDCKSEPEYSESPSNCDFDSINTSDNDDSNIYSRFNYAKSHCNSSNLPLSDVLQQPDFESTFISLQNSENDVSDSSSVKHNGGHSSKAHSDLMPLRFNGSSNITEAIKSCSETSINDGLNRHHETDMETVKNTLQSVSGSDHSSFLTPNVLELQLDSDTGGGDKYEFEAYSFSPNSLDLHKLISIDVEMCDVKIDANSTKLTSLTSLVSPNYSHINSINIDGVESVVTHKLSQQNVQEEFDKLNHRMKHADTEDDCEANFNSSLKVTNVPLDSKPCKEDSHKNNLTSICSIAHLFNNNLDCLTNDTSSNDSGLPGITSFDDALVSGDKTKNYFDSFLNGMDEDISLKSSIKDHFKAPTLQNIEVLLNSDLSCGDDNLEERKSEEIDPNCSKTFYIGNEQKANYCVSSPSIYANCDIGVNSDQSNSENLMESQSHSELENSSECVPCLQLNALFIPNIDGDDYVEDKIIHSKIYELQQDNFINSTLNRNLHESKVEISSSSDTHTELADYEQFGEELANQELQDEELTDEELSDEERTNEELTDVELSDEEPAYEKLADEKPANEKLTNEELTDVELVDEELTDKELAGCNQYATVTDDSEKNYDSEFILRNNGCLANKCNINDLVNVAGNFKNKHPVSKNPKVTPVILALMNINQELVDYDSLCDSDYDNGYEEIEDEPNDRDLVKTPDFNLMCDNGNDDFAYLQNHQVSNVKQIYENEREFLNSSFEICDDDDLSNSESEFYEKYENVDAVNVILGDSYETAENCALRDIFDAELEISKHNIDICEFKKIIREIHDLKILLGMTQKESLVDNEKDYGIEEDVARSEVSSDSDVEKIVTAQANDNDACESDLESISDDSTCGTLDLVSLFSVDPSFDITNKDSILAESFGEEVDCKCVTFSDINGEIITDSCINLEDEIRSIKEQPSNINTISDDVDFRERNQNGMDTIFYSNGRYCIFKNQINNFCNFFSTLSQIFCKSENNVCGSLRDPTKESPSSLRGTYVSFHLPVNRSSPNVVETEPSSFPLFDITRITPTPSTEMPTTFKLFDDRMSPYPFLENGFAGSEKEWQSSAAGFDDKDFDLCMDEVFLAESSDYFTGSDDAKKLQPQNQNRAPNIESRGDINYIYRLNQNMDEEFCKKNENVQQENLITKSTTTLESDIEFSKY